jgi:hypothetical protein
VLDDDHLHTLHLLFSIALLILTLLLPAHERSVRGGWMHLDDLDGWMGGEGKEGSSLAFFGVWSAHTYKQSAGGDDYLFALNAERKRDLLRKGVGGVLFRRAGFIILPGFFYLFFYFASPFASPHLMYSD